jgi:hypothetical protein
MGKIDVLPSWIQNPSSTLKIPKDFKSLLAFSDEIIHAWVVQPLTYLT